MRLFSASTTPQPFIPQATANQFNNPVIFGAKGQDHGDPFVLKHRSTYYLYHTGKLGVGLHTSSDLVTWQSHGIVLGPPPDPEHFAQIDFWAPEVLYHQGVFYMYVAATKRTLWGKGNDHLRRMGVAHSHSPLGPFIWNTQPLVNEWSIDGHPFRAPDGSLWLYYNIRTEATRYHDGTTGCGNVVDQMLEPERLLGDPRSVVSPNLRWEGNRKGNWYWNEGPFVLRRRDLYYQLYSGGFFGDETYGIGLASSPTPAGPWSKYPGNPIFKSNAWVQGPGHLCVQQAPDGVTAYAVYHGYLPKQKGRKVHLNRIFWVGDRVMIEGPSLSSQPLPPQPLYDPAVQHWNLEAWVQGTTLQVLGVEIILSPEPHLLRVVRRRHSAWIYLDGLLLYSGLAGSEKPQVEVENGEVQSQTLTSWLDDEEVYHLAAGEQQCWEWGGSEGLEVSLAVKGQLKVRLGNQEHQIEAPQQYTLFRLMAQEGAQRLELEGIGEGASLTDVSMSARSKAYIHQRLHHESQDAQLHQSGVSTLLR